MDLILTPPILSYVGKQELDFDFTASLSDAAICDDTLFLDPSQTQTMLVVAKHVMKTVTSWISTEFIYSKQIIMIVQNHLLTSF